MQILEVALDYHRRGWAVIPCRKQSKVAACKWKGWTIKPQTEDDIRKLFASDGLNIAVICGDISGGLVVRDFDKEAAYRTWAASNPEQAKTLPTVKTARGYHTYCTSTLQKIEHLPDGTGELRGGGYCLLPPSIHPDGTRYTWQIEPNGELPEIDLDVFSVLDIPLNGTERQRDGETERQRHRDTEDIEDIEAIRERGSNKPKPKTKTKTKENKEIKIASVESAIIQTLPKHPGQRNRKLFDLARLLKSNPAFTEADPETLRPIVEDWHEQARETIQTKDFFTTWADFLYAFDKVKFLGDGPMLAIKEKIEGDGLHCPPGIIEHYPDAEPFQRLASICYELQRLTEPEPFFLSCRTAGDLLGIPPRTAHRWLWLLEKDGYLHTVQRGRMHHATRFKFIEGGQDAD